MVDFARQCSAEFTPCIVFVFLRLFREEETPRSSFQITVLCCEVPYCTRAKPCSAPLFYLYPFPLLLIPSRASLEVGARHLVPITVLELRQPLLLHVTLTVLHQAVPLP